MTILFKVGAKVKTGWTDLLRSAMAQKGCFAAAADDDDDGHK
jgi:hypothetical protein